MALVMVWEGLIPTLNPELFRRMMTRIIQMQDAEIRRMGLSSMIIGAVLVYWLKN